MQSMQQSQAFAMETGVQRKLILTANAEAEMKKIVDVDKVLAIIT